MTMTTQGAPAAEADPFGQPALPLGPRQEEDGLVRNGRYRLPDPESGKDKGWTRVTTLVKTISDQFTLGEWEKRMVVLGLGAREDLYWRAAAADPDDRDGLNKLAKEAKEAAKASRGANLGTALHGFKEAVEAGRPVAMPAAVRPKLASFQALMVAHQITTVPGYTERVVRIDKYGAAGKFDDIVDDARGNPLLGCPPGIRIGDLKSQKRFWTWLEISAQLSCYADADAIWNPELARYEDMPPVCKDWATVTWMPVNQDEVHLFDVPLAPGREVAGLCNKIRELRNAAKKWGTLRPVPAIDVVEAYGAALRDAGTLEELSAAASECRRLGVWCDELEAVGQQTLQRIAR